MKRFRGLDRKDAIAPAEPNKPRRGLEKLLSLFLSTRSSAPLGHLPASVTIVGALGEPPAEQAEKAFDEACKAAVDREDLFRRTVLTVEEGQAKETS